MVLTGETREMQENATPAKEPNYREGVAEMRLLFVCGGRDEGQKPSALGCSAEGNGKHI
jgi:hypothetical protein